MKKITAWILTMVLLAQCSMALAQRTSHEITMFGILEKMATKETDGKRLYHSAGYNEEKDAYVITYQHEDMTKEQYDKIVGANRFYPYQLEGLSQKNLYAYFRDWMDMYGFEIDIVIRHISSDEQFLICLLNGKMIDTDWTEHVETEANLKLVESRMQFRESHYETLGDVDLEWTFDRETKKISVVYRDLINRNTQKQAREELKSVYRNIRDRVYNTEIMGLNFELRYENASGNCLVHIKNGDIVD